MPDSAVFALSDPASPKMSPSRIHADETAFAAITEEITRSLEDLDRRISLALRTPPLSEQGRLERDIEVHRLTSRRRALSRTALDACLGRIVPADGSATLYIGRIGLTGENGESLLVDWRSPAAEPFFAATLASPSGIASRRRYRWSGGRVVDYWDETFTGAIDAALETDSAILATLAEARTPQMRDVLGTIAAEQDAIIRAHPRGPLLVDGGPGTGKTVVALHRAAYLSYSDVRISSRHGGILVIGPHQPYLDYVADVLPGLGEDEVRTVVLADLVPEGTTAQDEPDPRISELKADRRMIAAIDLAVALYEEPPQQLTALTVHGVDVHIDGRDWADAFAAVAPGTPHHEARTMIWDEIAEIVLSQLEEAAGYDEDGRRAEEISPEELRRLLQGESGLRSVLHRAWPVLEATDLLGDLWEVPAYLRRCAPWLEEDEVALLQRAQAPRDWTTSDLPLLDALRFRLGDPRIEADRERRERAREVAAHEMESVVDYLVQNDGSEMRQMSMLRGADMAARLHGEPAAQPLAGPDGLEGPFAHVVVDEAQELTDAQWAMVLRRCPSRSITLVGDRAQARDGFEGTWAQRLERAGLTDVRETSLGVNYRTPQEVMDVAEPVIREAMPDARVPLSVRESGIPVRRGRTQDLRPVLEDWLARRPEGIACVIARTPPVLPGHLEGRVRSLSPHGAKGLEFDLVVLADPESFGEGTPGAVARYVAMTRATQELVLLSPN